MKESLKPIVPGCLCIIINCKQQGLQVTTIEKGYPPFRNLVERSGQPCWKIDKIVGWKYSNGMSGPRINYCPEHNLIRIDPDEESKKMFEKEKRDIVVKKPIKLREAYNE